MSEYKKESSETLYTYLVQYVAKAGNGRLDLNLVSSLCLMFTGIYDKSDAQTAVSSFIVMQDGYEQLFRSYEDKVYTQKMSQADWELSLGFGRTSLIMGYILKGAKSLGEG